MSPNRLPVYFLGIGGPNTIGKKDHPAYSRLAAAGQDITKKIKPKAIVVISAHWNSGSSQSVKINSAEESSIIYDFWGFPKHFYEYKFPYKGSTAIANRAAELLKANDIGVELVDRGLDHGVWAGFVAAFDPQENLLDIPIVQISMFANEDTDQHYRLGKALAPLRDQGVQIVGTGMVVHNLTDFRMALSKGVTLPYTYDFDEAVKDAATADPQVRREKMIGLMKREDARQAHPTCEHLLPLYVAAGAAGEDAGEQIWTLAEGSLSWAQYRFGSFH